LQHSSEGKRFAIIFVKSLIMKKILLAAICIASINILVAQEPSEGKVEYQKKELPAAIIELPYPPNVVENAIKDYLYKRGVKGITSKGFQIFKATKLPEMNMESYDIYFKVERKSRSDKDASIVYLFATKENESPENISNLNYDLTSAKSLLKSIIPSVQSDNLEAEIAGQENAIKKAEKKYDNLIDDGRSLEKKIKKLEDNLQENRKDVEKQRQDIENQKRILETLKERRKIG